MRRPRGALLDVLLTAAFAALVASALGHAFLNYDTFYALVWGGELVDGRRPQYAVPYAPTPHPLAIAVGASVSPLGEAAEEALLAAGVLGLGALAVGLLRLGQAVYAWPVGALAALIVLTRVPYLSYGVRGYVDLPAAALVVWAAVLEARRPRRGILVLALLALAGLLRPEAWLLAGVYWLYVLPGRAWPERLRLGALVVAAPLVWMAMDALLTGDPLHSVEVTRVYTAKAAATASPSEAASAIASVSGSFRPSAAARAREICETWTVCVSRVTKWSPSGLRKTCVLCFRRRKALE